MLPEIMSYLIDALRPDNQIRQYQRRSDRLLMRLLLRAMSEVELTQIIRIFVNPLVFFWFVVVAYKANRVKRLMKIQTSCRPLLRM